MKRLLILVSVLFILVGCSREIVDTGRNYPNISQEKNNPVAMGVDGELLYIDDVKAIGLEFDKNAKWVEPDKMYLETMEKRPPGKGKIRVAWLSLPSEPQLSTDAITNVMLDPVEYSGALPTDNNGGFVDWDGDGLSDDYIEYNWRCYYPRSFAWVDVYIDNGETPLTINNSIAFGAELLGFDDVNGDGTQDAIWQGGNHRKYNPDDNGLIEPYSEYNVGFNIIGEEPTPLDILFSELSISVSVNNPDFVRWDLGDQYEGYVFHVYWREVDPVTLEPIPTSVGWQTLTYGDWGIGMSHLTPGATFLLRATNLGDDCSDIIIYFTLQ